MAATRFRSAAGGSTTIEVEDIEVETLSRAEDTSSARLLVNLDTSNRTEAELIANTIRELLEVASREDAHSVRDMVKNAIVIAFKRRNHKKSMADGEGPGEKRIFLEILIAIIGMERFDDLVMAVLPLIPIYGSWRDLAMLAEMLIAKSMTTVEDDVPSSPIVKAICEIFAKQIMEDDQHLESEPSNACKYCPHEGRHRTKKRKADAMEVEEDHEPERRRRKSNRKGRSAEDKLEISKHRKANAHLSSAIARLVSPSDPDHAHAALRRIRARLNARLQEKGHLVEPLLCDHHLDSIDFVRANKGSLLKYSKAIKKDEAAAEKWKAAMSKDAKAIPDMSDLLAAVKLFLEEEVAAETADPATRVDIFPLQLEKAITTLSGAQTTLFRKAKRLLSAAGDRTEEEIDELLAAMPKVIIVVDTADCEERPQRLALFLAGMLLSKALGRETMVVDGQSVDLSEAMVDSWDALCPAMPSSTTGAIRRLEASFEVARQHMQEEGAKKYDVLFLCRRFAAGEEDNDAVVQLLERFQKAAEPRLRTLRLHRIRHRAEMVGTECISFMPRPRATPLNPTLASADLLFMVDFTGSMGAYIEAVKTELVSLIQELRASTRLQHVRVGLVGYRDYRDEGRVVTVDFRDQDNAGRVVEAILSQQASGGGDAPEDLLSGFVAAHSLSWRSDVRVMVIITDADAHGCNPNCHDNFPSGRCPDQSGQDYPSLAEALGRLALEDRVDSFFCQLNDHTNLTQRALHKVYEDHLGGKGFGTISMQVQGVQSFRAQVLSSVAAAVLGSLAEKDVMGLQTADGSSVSSIANSLQASIRESLSALGVVDAEEEEKKAESDWERLQREMVIEALQPVRMALGLPLPANAETLSHRASAALYKAGLTVEMLEKNGYPQPVIAAFRAYLQTLLPVI